MSQNSKAKQMSLPSKKELTIVEEMRAWPWWVEMFQKNCCMRSPTQ
jgi:hypothetical protein